MSQATGRRASPGYQERTASEVLDALGSSRHGLTTSEAQGRLAEHGPNELRRPHRTSVLRKFAGQFTDLFAVLLLSAAVITFAAYLLSDPPDIGNLQLTIAILAVVLINAVIGFMQEHMAERTAEALQAMVPHRARVIREDERVEVSVAELVPGDLVVIDAGDAISADCRLIEAHELTVNNMALTGESAPARRHTEPVPVNVARLEAQNLVWMGTAAASGTGKAVVVATGQDTEFGRIYQLTAGTSTDSSPLRRQIAMMAHRVAAAAFSLGVLLFTVRLAAEGPLVETFIFALGVMVALVPEGLPATMSVALAIGVRRMAKRHALIKKLLAVETLGSTTVICTDKTGTLTKAEMTVQALWASGNVHRVTGAGYEPKGDAEDPEPVRDMLRVAALCCDARLLPPADHQGWRVLGDTTEGALLVAAGKAGIDLDAERQAAPRVGELPFDSVRKLMTTVHAKDGRTWAYVKGAPQELLARCTHIRFGDTLSILDDEQRSAVLKANDDMAGSALRVLAVAVREVSKAAADHEEAEHGLILLGLVGMLDPPRPEVVAAVKACREAGIRIVMATGDYALTAEAIARRVGILRPGMVPRTVTGIELDQMSKEELRTLLGEYEHVLFARVKPEHKMRVVSAFKDLGEIVAVTGDGANDAPALKRADIGVAMGESGTDVAREASVMVLLDDSFASIAAAVELGRSVYQNIRKFLIYVFSSNVGELVPILAATFLGFPHVPISAVQVLAIDLGTDVLPALALGAEKPEPGVMRQPPRNPKQSLFSGALVRRILFLGGIEAVVATGIFFWHVTSAVIPFAEFTEDNPIYREALTMAHLAIIMSQVFVGLAVRSDRISIFRLGLLSNPHYLVAQAIGLILMAGICYLPPLQDVFNTKALSFTDWLLVLALSSLVLVADEIRKAVLNRKEATR
ncbi:cation-transporting P-type ATPase [Kibdelosporangium philippinense]|uniref:Cation-transporting P-type ATPase n=1 Tax=Kibdelosporangium philippinense TaxID=211113 RepID=A0ABS8Z9V9_9PSEU|nr:cation-transporting P-type ATPase [Kibdelosporangium philippinense]MCE7004649.1 cation-transporting P-type ATPase [Kibdelosporangium philippinense]